MVGGTDAQLHNDIVVQWCSDAPRGTSAESHNVHLNRVSSLVVGQGFTRMTERTYGHGRRTCCVIGNSGRTRCVHRDHTGCSALHFWKVTGGCSNIAKHTLLFKNAKENLRKWSIFYTIPTMTFFIQFGVKLTRTDSKYRWYMIVLRFAPYCNQNLTKYQKVLTESQESLRKWSISTRSPLWQILKIKSKKKQKKSENRKKSQKKLIKKEILVVMVSPPLETLARRNLPQLRYWVIWCTIFSINFDTVNPRPLTVLIDFSSDVSRRNSQESSTSSTLNMLKTVQNTVL